MNPPAVSGAGLRAISDRPGPGVSDASQLQAQSDFAVGQRVGNPLQILSGRAPAGNSLWVGRCADRGHCEIFNSEDLT